MMHVIFFAQINRIFASIKRHCASCALYRNDLLEHSCPQQSPIINQTIQTLCVREGEGATMLVGESRGMQGGWE